MAFLAGTFVTEDLFISLFALFVFNFFSSVLIKEQYLMMLVVALLLLIGVLLLMVVMWLETVTKDEKELSTLI